MLNHPVENRLSLLGTGVGWIAIATAHRGYVLKPKRHVQSIALEGWCHASKGKALKLLIGLVGNYLGEIQHGRFQVLGQRQTRISTVTACSLVVG